jgi:hypothetical protein
VIEPSCGQWADPMYDLLRAHSSFVWIWFLAVAVLGGMIVVNLFVAVLFQEFKRSQAIMTVKRELDRRTAAAAKLQALQRGKSGRVKVKVMREQSFLVREDSQRGRCCICQLVSSSVADAITILLILGNTAILCLPYAGQTREYCERLEALSTMFALAFAVELLVRIVVLGWDQFIRDSWNCFDCTVVGVSLVEIVVSAVLSNTGSSAIAGLRVLRLVRILRMARLVRFWPGMQRVFAALLSASPQLANVFCLLFIFMTVFALLGMQIFAGHCGSDDSRWHYDFYDPPCSLC